MKNRFFITFAIQAIFLTGAALHAQDIGDIQIHVGGDASFIVVDSLGRKSGYDPTLNREYDEIPNASFGTDYPEDAPVYEFMLPSPQTGTFKVDVIGAKDGQFKIGIFLTQDDLGHGCDFYSSGNCTQASVTQYTFYYAQDTTRVLKVDQIPSKRHK